MLDTRELVRRAGTMQRLRRKVPAPADLGTSVIGVPAGSEIELDLRLESVVEGVLVSGTARAQLAGDCVRCLDPLAERFLLAGLQDLYAYPDVEADRNDEAENEERHLEGNLLDLEPALRDAVVLELPLSPVCRDDCPGLCARCGARLADEPEHVHLDTDPRWAALAGLLTDRSPGASPERSTMTEES